MVIWEVEFCLLSCRFAKSFRGLESRDLVICLDSRCRLLPNLSSSRFVSNFKEGEFLYEHYIFSSK